MTAFTTRERRPSDADSEAIRWLVELQSDATTAEDRRKFDRWLAESESHAAAYREVQRFWNGLDGLDPDDVTTLDRFLDEAPRRFALPPPGSEPRRLWASFGVLAAAVACLLVGTWWLIQTFHLWADYHTGTGGRQTITLADGSTIDLNTQSALSLDLSQERRRIVLHRGEAFFVVAPDRDRPFEVAVGTAVVRALGTAFNVQVDAERVTVTVLEHRVRVTNPDNITVDVAEGHRLAYTSSGTFGPVEHVDLGRALAWRRDRLIFENRPIAAVIKELDRYWPGWIVLADPSLSTLTITGVFDTRRPENGLRAIEETLPVRMVRVTDRLILLYRDGSQSPTSPSHRFTLP